MPSAARATTVAAMARMPVRESGVASDTSAGAAVLIAAAGAAAELALDCLQAARAEPLVIDLADARVLRGVLAGVPMDAAQLQDVVQALQISPFGVISAVFPNTTVNRRALGIDLCVQPLRQLSACAIACMMI